MSGRMGDEPGPRVMVVDDNAQNLALVDAQLRLAGYRVTLVDNGPDALAAAATDPPDLILLDILMPGMDGYEVCRRLKGDEATHTVPVVMLSSLQERVDKIRGLDVGADDFLSKPFDSAELLARAASLVRLNRLYNQLAQGRDEIAQQAEQLSRSNAELRQLAAELEERVAQRTTELQAANQHLERELEERQRAEQTLLQSERRKGAILESSLDCIITADQEGRITEFNPAAEQTFGYTREQVLGKELAETIIPPSLREAHRRGLAHYLATGEGPVLGQRIEIMALRADGTEFPVELAISAIELDGRPVFTAGLRDISAKKAAEAALMNTSQQLWQAAKLATMGELAASVAHELNNPLATVSLRMEAVLAQTPGDDSRRRALEIIEGEVERMGQLVANLLQFSRRGHAQISSIDLPSEIEGALQLIQYQLRNRGIAIVQEFGDDLPIIHADRQLLRQLFLNLLTNASDAMDRGAQLTIRVAATMLDDGAPAVRIEFADTGAGIAPEDLPKVTDPFFTTKPEGKGTGLGLAICRRVAQEHHGTFDITSRLGEGTTVSVVLPTADGTNAAVLRSEGVDA